LGIIFSSFNGLEAYPRLRFKAYLNAWNISPLKDLASYGNKRTSVNKRHFISTENMLQNFQGIEQYVDETVVSGVKFEKNDILLANIRPYLRKVWYATFDGAASTDVLVIHTNKQNSLFLKYIIANDKFIDYVMGAAKGCKMPRGDKNFIMDYKVGYPSLPEQQKIANFLSLVDQRIEKQRQLVESLKKYKRGLFSYYFQKNESYKIVRLGEFAKIYQPSTISQSQFNDGEYKVFGANGYIGNYDQYNHETPQVTISCRGEKCGTVNFVDAYTWITGNSMVVNIDEQNKINKRYLYHCLSNQNLKYLVSGSAQPQIIRSDVARHSIPVPSIEFQEKLSFFLDSIEQKIKNEQIMEESLLDMKNAFLQQMFI